MATKEQVLQKLAAMNVKIEDIAGSSFQVLMEDKTFPDMTDMRAEKVIKRWYNWEEKRWESEHIVIKIWRDPFAKGALRIAHYMVVVHPDGNYERMVAKQQMKDKHNHKSQYYDDAFMQAACQAVAKAFNERRPAKKVEFVDAFIIQRLDGSWWSCEKYIDGVYTKYNNNNGYVSKTVRNTPQAFSHFSYVFTEGRMMIVDIQGVGDHYTDPQIHTIDGKGFGEGNLGMKGINRFLDSHWCSSICQYLDLPFCVPKNLNVSQSSANILTEGTVVSGRTPVLDTIHIADFIGNLRPHSGGVKWEDLALLGISEKSMAAAGSMFNKLDTDHTELLDREKLQALVQYPENFTREWLYVEDFMGFLTLLAQEVRSKGTIDFKTFMLCWTDNL